MKKLFFLLIVLLVIVSCSSSKTDNSILVSGNIQNNSDYMGGANPPQEIIDDLAVYNPSMNQNFYVRSGTVNTPYTTVLTNFSTDFNGNFNVNLQPGVYSIITERKYNFEQIIPSTQACDWLLNPDFLLTVTPSQNTYNKQYTINLNYCMPLPD